MAPTVLHPQPAMIGSKGCLKDVLGPIIQLAWELSETNHGGLDRP